MRLASTMLAGLLALNTVSIDAIDAIAGPRGGGKSGLVVRPRTLAQNKALRSVTGVQFVAEAKADAKKLLAELRLGLEITEVNTLGKDATTGASAVLATVSGMLGGNVAGVALRLKKDNQMIIRIGKVTAALPATTSTAPAAEQPAEAPEDDDE